MFSAFTCLLSFQMTNNLKENKSGLMWVILQSCLLNNQFNFHTSAHNLGHTVWTSSCTSSYTPGSGGGQESPCSEFSRFRGGYTQQHGDVISWGQPRPAVRHQDGSGHIGGDPAGQEKSAVGHLCLVACSLQGNGLKRASRLPSGATWEIELRKKAQNSSFKTLNCTYTWFPTFFLSDVHP